MTKPPKTFRTTDEEDEMIQVRLSELGYNNFSPYVRHLIRMDYRNSRNENLPPAPSIPSTGRRCGDGRGEEVGGAAVVGGEAL